MEKVILKNVDATLGESTKTFYIKAPPKKGVKRHLNLVFCIVGIGSFVLSILIALPFKFGFSDQIFFGYQEIFKKIGLVLLGIPYLILMSYGVGFSIVGLRDVFKIFKRPTAQIIENAKKTAITDFEFFAFLLKQNLVDLKYTLVHLKSECVALEGRASLLIGVINKVGIFPALVSYFALVQKMDLTANKYLEVIIYLAPILYALAFLDESIRTNLNRHIALYELAIETIENESDQKEVSTDTSC